MDRKRRFRKSLLGIVNSALADMNAGTLLETALKNYSIENNYILVAIGKAAWQMAKAAHEMLGNRIIDGIVITKYEQSKGKIGNLEILEAGHPIVDENSLIATQKVIEKVQNLNENIHVLFLISGGGSALFEMPATGIQLSELQAINRALINSGASIKEINAVRKHLSMVKGGRFAEMIFPARIHSFILSDVVGEDLNSIASGPTVADPATSNDVIKILRKYGVNITKGIESIILHETPKHISNSDYTIIGNNKDLCKAVFKKAEKNDLDAELISSKIEMEVAEFADLIEEKIIQQRKTQQIKPKLLIFGGEPVVKVSGKGTGGRNQHLALLMAKRISEMENVFFLSVASDGSDGPTDAAGGIVDGYSWQEMKDLGIDPEKALVEFDSYNCLLKSGDLIKTGATGTNLNDILLALIY